MPEIENAKTKTNITLHISKDKYASYCYIQGDKFFELNDYGSNDKIKSFDCNGIKFDSDNCYTSAAIYDRNRNFYIEKDGKFTISIDKNKSICAVEFQEDVEGIASVDTISAKMTNRIESDEYITYEFDEPEGETKLNSVTFIANADFYFEDFIVYYK